MPVIKEFTVLLEDRPSTLGSVCRTLAERGVNILALQSFPTGGKIVTRFIVDIHDKSVSRGQKLSRRA